MRKKLARILTPRQYIPYTDRMDYLAGMNMNLGWAMTVEKLLKLQLSDKARHLRVIIAEMNRIASHLGGHGGLLVLDLGTFSPFLYAFREREKILDLFELACGARLTYSYLTVGGATHDLPSGWLKQCSEFLDQLLPVIAECHTLLTTNSIFIKRTAGLGIMSPEMAIDYGCTGPVLRGSGVDHDLRRDGEDRYTSMYDGYAFEVIVERDGHYPRDHEYPAVPREAVLGDCWHRFYVRMLEVMQAIDLVRQGIDRYSTAKGDYGIPVKLAEKLPKGEAYLETERCRARPRWVSTLSATVRRFPGVPERAAVASATCRSRTSCAVVA